MLKSKLLNVKNIIAITIVNAKSAIRFTRTLTWSREGAAVRTRR